jgi:hypothetical protein
MLAHNTVDELKAGVVRFPRYVVFHRADFMQTVFLIRHARAAAPQYCAAGAPTLRAGGVLVLAFNPIQLVSDNYLGR